MRLLIINASLLNFVRIAMRIASMLIIICERYRIPIDMALCVDLTCSDSRRISVNVVCILTLFNIRCHLFMCLLTLDLSASWCQDVNNKCYTNSLPYTAMHRESYYI